MRRINRWLETNKSDLELAGILSVFAVVLMLLSAVHVFGAGFDFRTVGTTTTEIIRFRGRTTAPSVSEPGMGGFYFDQLTQQVKFSYNGGLWAPLGSGAGGSGVTTFNLRAGAVTPQPGDYLATQIASTATGDVSATNVQSAIAELAAEKISAAGIPVSSVFTRTGAIAALQADYDAFFHTPAEADALLLTPAEGDAAYVNVGGDTITGTLGIGGANLAGRQLTVLSTTVGAQVMVYANNATGGGVAELTAGNGTTSSRFAYIRFASAETVPQNWDTGMYGTKNFVIRDTTAAADRVLIDTSGNVGIGGTPAGASKLDVLGVENVAIFRGTPTTGAYIQLYDATAVLARGYMGYGSTLFSGAAISDFGLRSQGGLSFATNGGAVGMKIDTAGVTNAINGLKVGSRETKIAETSQTFTYDPASIANGAALATDFVMTGSPLPNLTNSTCTMGFQGFVGGGTWSTGVYAVNNTGTVRVTLANFSGVAVDLGSGQLRISCEIY